MRRQIAAYLLPFWLILPGASAYAQSIPPQNATPNKKACDYLTKAEAESLLGPPVESRADNATGCVFVNMEGLQPGQSKTGQKRVSLTVLVSPSPDADRLVAVRKGIAIYPVPSSAVLKDVPDFGDAAIWLAVPPLGGSLWAFKGGTIQVEVIFSGIPNDAAFQYAKAIAAKALGGTGGTGYAYLGTPKGNAAEAAATAKLMQQGKTYSQAPYITQSQFLKSVKEVSLTLESDPSLGRYISAAEQRSDIVSELTKYGIAVRPNAPVSLVAKIDHHVTVITRTYSAVGGGRIVDQGNEQIPVHDLAVTLRFLVRAGAWRNGTFHVVSASPASGSIVSDLIEDSASQKSVYGDTTLREIKDTFTEDLAGSLKSIASNSKAETKPWYVTSWTDKDKASADAEFTRIMSPQSAIDKRPLDGLDTVPELSLEHVTDADECDPNSSWGDLWTKAFQRMGLVAKRGEPTLLLHHVYKCRFDNATVASRGRAPLRYYWMFDTISLVESNVVFDLNGTLVRRPGELLLSLNTARALERDIKSAMPDYFPRSISGFLAGLPVGVSAAPAPRP